MNYIFLSLFLVIFLGNILGQNSPVTFQRCSDCISYGRVDDTSHIYQVVLSDSNGNSAIYKVVNQSK